MNKATYGKLEGGISIVVNILLFIIKYWAGIVSGSVALIADAWHTLSDSLSSIIILISYHFVEKPADFNHPFGHGRAELIASFFLGTLLSFVGFSFLVESFQKFFNHEVAVFGTLAIVVTVISIVANELLTQFAFWAAKKSDSECIKADAWHHRSDAISSLIILVGIFVGKYIWWIDSALGLIVSLMIFKVAYDILAKTISEILGVVPSKKLINKVTEISDKILGNHSGAHHFHLHTYGEHKELTFHIRLPNKMTVKKAHDLVEDIEFKIKKDLKIDATIHIEPEIFETK